MIPTGDTNGFVDIMFVEQCVMSACISKKQVLNHLSQS
jgi:hypothetical protein